MSGQNPAETGNRQALLEFGQRRVRWTEQHMRGLRRLREQFRQRQPFAGLTIGMCLHVEPKTAVLCGVLQAGGAQVVITGSPGTTKDDTVAAGSAAGASRD
jgi:adenosylhomocysteinase